MQKAIIHSPQKCRRLSGVAHLWLANKSQSADPCHLDQVQDLAKYPENLDGLIRISVGADPCLRQFGLFIGGISLLVRAFTMDRHKRPTAPDMGILLSTPWFSGMSHSLLTRYAINGVLVNTTTTSDDSRNNWVDWTVMGSRGRLAQQPSQFSGNIASWFSNVDPARLSHT